MKRIPTVLLVLLFSFLFISCGTKDFRKDYFSVKKVVDGNTILLKNGYQVHLLGVSNTEAGKQFLEEELLIRNKKVRFRFDTSSPRLRITKRDKKRELYAYVRTERASKGFCLNSVMLRDKNIPLELHPYLNDSLYVYRTYAGAEKDEAHIRPIPHRNVVPDNESVFIYRWDGDCTKNIDILEKVCDVSHSVTRNFAISCANKSPGSYHMGQVCEIFNTLYTGWKYVSDPYDSEYIAKASESISNADLSGDCDDYAILMYSVITAIGGRARINVAWSESSGHAFAEVDISKFDRKEVERVIRRYFNYYQIDKLFITEDNTGAWLNMDWFAGYPGGKYYSWVRRQVYTCDRNIWSCNQ